MNYRQWEETPLSKASRLACVESVRRQYVEKLTRDFADEMSVVPSGWSSDFSGIKEETYDEQSQDS